MWKKSMAMGIALMFSLGCAGAGPDGGGEPDAVDTRYFPANWKSTYVKVQSCSPTQHPIGGSVEVWVSSDIAEALAVDGPVPVGGTILKVQWTEDGECTTGECNLFTIMRKLSEGSDPDHGDWDWQTAGADGTLGETDPASCVACHTPCAGLLCTEL